MIALGVIIGLLLAIVVMLSVKRYQTPIDRFTKQVENYTKEKGEIFNPDEDVENMERFIAQLPDEPREE